MKTLVAYKSRYGSTKQYAEWIAEAVAGDVVPAEKVDPGSFPGYDIIVFGSYVRIGKVIGTDFLQKNWQSLKGKRLFIFIVSGTRPGDPDSEAILESIPAEIRKDAKVFQLMGRVGKLDIGDRLLMLFPKTAAWLKYRRTKNEADRKELERLSSFDDVDKGSVSPIIKEIKR
jgi:menaquinone-dependent protoporphyrinogen oxidase